ncbi:MAG TPA: hypothetical protein VL096_06460 [Pirellulaceae bacterium]|nr:hypothetical protein [Pirellulaceae bacterium]
MKNIDFLPAKYQERYAARIKLIKRWTIVLGLAFSVTPLAAYQYVNHRSAVLKLAEIEPAHTVAVAETQRLGELQRQLNTARSEAALLAYLGHPWPRTQVLAHIHQPLPDAVRLTGITLRHEPKSGGNPTESGRGRAARRSESSEPSVDDQRPATERDLTKLSEQLDQQDVIVTLNGVTIDTTDLHTYVAKLRISGLFVKSELKSLEAMPGQETGKAQRFEIRLVVAPGHRVSPKGKANPALDTSVAGRTSNTPVLSAN